MAGKSVSEIVHRRTGESRGVTKNLAAGIYVS